MSETSPVLALPYIQPSQAQKHVTHNEALRLLDAITQLTVLSSTLIDPPSAPNPGDRYIVASGPTGDWAGQGNKIAIFTGQDWQFFEPAPGWRADITPTGATLRFDGAEWLPVDAGAGSGGNGGSGNNGSADTLPQLGINASADATNKLVVQSPASLFSHEGDDHRIKINKAGPGDTASLLFQTSYSGRAEMGTAGSDDFEIKTSGNGSVFNTALRSHAATGFTSVRKRFFSAHLSNIQTGISHNSYSKVYWNSMNANDDDMFIAGAGNLTPPAGAISLSVGLRLMNQTAYGNCTLAIRKNGVHVGEHIFMVLGSGEAYPTMSLHDVCDGSDTYDVVALSSNPGGQVGLENEYTYFRGFHH